MPPLYFGANFALVQLNLGTSGSLVIRSAVPADAGAIADVHVAAWRATYQGIVAQSHLDGLSVDERTAAWERRLRLGAESGIELFVADAGGADAQGQGIGRRLASTWAAAAVDRGWTAAIVEALANNNPARGFYEHLGARYLEDAEVVIGGETYLEARYAWADLRVLAG